ncbi:MAG: glycosyltransferase family 2 protein [Gemmatimonadaceae bacterium]
MHRRLISVVTACYNEEDNVRLLYEAVRDQMAKFPQYRYEHVFIDNASTDATQQILRALASADPRVKAIFNNRNFGPVRSPMHGLLAARGDAVIGIACDFQDPPDLIPELVTRWERGARTVLCVKPVSEESRLMYAVRSAYYRLLGRLSESEIVPQATGFGIFDRSVMDEVRSLNDPYPFFRGLLAEIGASVEQLPYRQPARARGKSKISLVALIDVAMLGLVNHTRAPLRLAMLVGFAIAGLSALIGFGYLIAKLLFWNSFSLGVAPIVSGFFLLSAVQLIFIGIVGEYVGAIFAQVKSRPLVFERERLNFDRDEPQPPAEATREA